jgi:hypothetical protein
VTGPSAALTLDDVIRGLAAVGRVLVARFGDSGSSAGPEVRESLHQRPGPWHGEMYARTGIRVSDLARIFRVSHGGVELAIEPEWRIQNNARRVRWICALALMPTQLLVEPGANPNGLPMSQLKEICRAHHLRVDNGQVQKTIREHCAEFKVGQRPLEMVWLTTSELGSALLTEASQALCLEAVAQALPLKSALAH